MTHFVIDYYDINIAQFYVTKESLCLDRIVLLNVFVICMKMYVLCVVFRYVGDFNHKFLCNTSGFVIKIFVMKGNKRLLVLTPKQ